MLKNITLAGLVAGLVALVGCAKKEEPVVAETKVETTATPEKAVEAPVEQTAQPAGETTAEVAPQAPESVPEQSAEAADKVVSETTEDAPKATEEVVEEKK